MSRQYAKGYKKPNHKYYARISAGNGYRYFYNQSEYQAYMGGGKSKGNVRGKTGNKFSQNIASTYAKRENTQKQQARSLLKLARKHSQSVAKTYATREANQRKSNSQINKTLNKKSQDIASTYAKRESTQKHSRSQVKNFLSKISKNISGSYAKREQNQHASDKQIAKAADKKSKDIAKTYAGREKNQKETSKKVTDALKNYIEPKDHKYIAKVQLDDGTFRYFYDPNELAAFYKTAEGKINYLQGFKLKKKKESAEDDAIDVNPENRANDGKDRGYSHNCYSCAIAFDMRRRGYDVQAIYDTNGENSATYEKAYKGVTVKDWSTDISVEKGSNGKTVRSAKILEKNMIKKYGNNSRGILCVTFKEGWGHGVSWEITDNKLHIYDAQIGKEVPASHYIKNAANFSSSISTLRTDDKQVTKYVTNYVTNDQKEAKNRIDKTNKGTTPQFIKDMEDHMYYYESGYGKGINTKVVEGDEK